MEPFGEGDVVYLFLIDRTTTVRVIGHRGDAMKRLLFVAAVVVFGFARGGEAQVLDHLKCHKMKDPLKFKAVADLTAELQPQFSAQGCTIGKPKLFCVPVTKENVQPPEAAPLQVDGQQLENDFVCYNVKCLDTPPDTEVSDQFGSRTQSRYRTTFVCAPALKGTITTTTTSGGGTTTTTIGGGSTCGQSAFPECNGTCATPGAVCAAISASACGCISTSQPCGSVQGPPTCAGACPPATPFCKTMGATCACSP